jgi:hypothetical protein
MQQMCVQFARFFFKFRFLRVPLNYSFYLSSSLIYLCDFVTCFDYLFLIGARNRLPFRESGGSCTHSHTDNWMNFRRVFRVNAGNSCFWTGLYVCVEGDATKSTLLVTLLWLTREWGSMQRVDLEFWFCQTKTDSFVGGVNSSHLNF